MEDYEEKSIMYEKATIKVTEDGYLLYKSVAFEDVVAKYHNMKIVLQ